MTERKLTIRAIHTAFDSVGFSKHFSASFDFYFRILQQVLKHLEDLADGSIQNYLYLFGLIQM